MNTMFQISTLVVRQVGNRSEGSRMLISAKQRRGFTLVELLVVIAIIGVLVALLLPAVQAAREAARKVHCSNNFKQVGLALHGYHNSLKEFPPGDTVWLAYDGMTDDTCGVQNAVRRTGIYFAWATYILPYMERQYIYDQFDFDEWSVGDLRTNYRAMGIRIDDYICPSDPQGGEYASNGVGPPFTGFNGAKNDDARLTNLAGVSDSAEWTCAHIWAKSLSLADGMLAQADGCRIAEVTDGTSNTLFVAEVTGGGSGSQRGHYWIALDLIDTRDGVNGPFTVPGNPSIAGRNFSRVDTGASSYHPGGCHFLFADGSVHFVSESISQASLAALTTRAGGDVADESDY